MCQIFGMDHPRGEYDRRKDKFSDISFKRRLEDVKNEMNGLVSFFEEIKYLIELTETEKEKDIRVFKIELIETKTEGEKKKISDRI